MIRFLHAADLHLDSPLRGLERYEGCPAEEVRRASRRALVNLVELAIAERVGFVLIAGDLYDGDLPDYGPCLFLNEQMLRLRDAGIAVVIISGNHDAASLHTKHLRLPENVRRLATDRAETRTFDDLGVAVHGQGFATRSVTENLAAAYPNPVRNVLNIGLLHTCVTGREGHDPYAPCSLDDLRAKEYQYWALGHVHTAETLCEDPPIVFPGNLQGRHIREPGAKGAVLVEADGDRVVRREARPLDVMRWATCAVDGSDAATEDDLLDRSRSSLKDLAEGADGRPVAVRVEIRGACAAHDRLGGRLDRLAAEVRREARDVGAGRLWVEKVLVKTRPERLNGTLDGPLRAVRDYLDRLRDDPTKLLEIGRKELADLKKKLPRGWDEEAGRPAIDAPERLLAALDHLGPELLGGLRGAAGVLADGDGAP